MAARNEERDESKQDKATLPTAGRHALQFTRLSAMVPAVSYHPGFALLIAGRWQRTDPGALSWLGGNDWGDSFMPYMPICGYRLVAPMVSNGTTHCFL